MLKYFPLCIAFIFIVFFSGPLYAMKRTQSPSSEEDTGLEMGRPQKQIIIKYINSDSCEPERIYGVLMYRFPPQGVRPIELEVEPIVKAVYDDNVPLLENILSTDAPDLTVITDNILSTNKAGSLLDIAADRHSFRCLEYFEKLLTMPQPELTLQAIACWAICAQNIPKLKAKAQRCCPDIAIDAQAELGKNIRLYYTIVPKLCTLYKAYRQRAVNIARMRSDIHCAQLIGQPYSCIK